MSAVTQKKYFLSVFALLCFSLFCTAGNAAFYKVSTVEELTASLTEAAGNGEDDIISMNQGTYLITATLEYNSEENYALTIQGEGKGAVLSGYGNRIFQAYTKQPDAALTFRNLTIQNGYSPEGHSGAGMHVKITSGNLLMENMVIQDCFAAAFYFSNNGGGAYITGGLGADITIRNSVVSGNHAKGQGGGLYINLIDGNLDFTNNTIINNHNGSSVVEGGGGVYLRLYDDTATVNMQNNIFWNNNYAHGPSDIYIQNNDAPNDGVSPVIFAYNDYLVFASKTSNNLTVASNISLDPHLSDDFHLQPGSPCIDIGNSAAPSLPALDPDGDSRNVDGDCTGSQLPDLGSDEYFTTPLVTTAIVHEITSTSAVSGGESFSDGHVPIADQGICWSTSNNPDLNDICVSEGAGSGRFVSTMTGLINGTTYYVRAYAENCMAIGYGNERSFTASHLPTVETLPVTAIDPPTALGGGIILGAGDSAVIGRGICWSQEQLPDLSDTCTANGTGTGKFSSTLSDLTVDATYYVRAYATNAAGTVYGNQEQFVAEKNSLLLLILPAILKDAHTKNNGL